MGKLRTLKIAYLMTLTCYPFEIYHSLQNSGCQGQLLCQNESHLTCVELQCNMVGYTISLLMNGTYYYSGLLICITCNLILEANSMWLLLACASLALVRFVSGLYYNEIPGDLDLCWQCILRVPEKAEYGVTEQRNKCLTSRQCLIRIYQKESLEATQLTEITFRYTLEVQICNCKLYWLLSWWRSP